MTEKMTDKIESLSDKIYNNVLGEDLGAEILIVEDVKEAINKLKDILHKHKSDHSNNCTNSSYGYDYQDVEWIFEDLEKKFDDEIFGEKLTT